MRASDDDMRSIQNMYACLALHPAVRDKAAAGEPVRLLLGFDGFHQGIASAIAAGAAAEFPGDAQLLPLETAQPDDIADAIARCDAFIFLYRSSTLQAVGHLGPAFLQPIKKTMQDNWKKSILFKDYGPHFHEAFAEPRASIAARNHRLMALAKESRQVVFEQADGGRLTGSIGPEQAWTSIDGDGNVDLTPGEIATTIRDLDGEVRFSGAFLSTIPFAVKYGVVRDFVSIRIRASQVVDFSCDDARFAADFDKYLAANAGNRTVEEFGIGTNCGVKGLYGLNAGFEERHPGLHLGLGGGVLGSHHLDLIFANGRLSFDGTSFFDDGFLI